MMTPGGERRKAGRPRIYKSRVAHHRRPDHEGWQPVHLTIRAVRGLPSLRSHLLAKAIGLAFHAAKKRGHVITQFSVQADHVHLIVEAKDRDELMQLARGMIIAFAKRINHTLRRRGRVFADRYHARATDTPWGLRRLLVYVLMNHKKHGASAADVDAVSSARWFDGFTTPLPTPTTPSPVSPSRTGLSLAWQDFGLISPAERPRGMDSSRPDRAIRQMEAHFARTELRPPPTPTCHQEPRISRS